MGLLDSFVSGGAPQGSFLDRVLQQLNVQDQYQPAAFAPASQPLTGSSIPAAGMGAGGSLPTPAPVMPAAPQNAPMPIGDYMMPRIGDGFTQDIRPPAQQMATQPAALQTPPLPQPQPLAQNLPPALAAQPGFSGALQGFARNADRGPIGALIGGIAGGLGYESPQQQNLRAQYQTLVPLLGADKALLAVLNPEVGKTLITNATQGRQFQFTTTPDGTVLRQDPHAGTAEPVYRAGLKPTFGVIAKDRYGQDVHGFIDPTTRKVFDINGNPIDTTKLAGSADATDPGVTGQAFLDTLPKGQGDTVKAVVEGRIASPGSFALSKPYWQRVIADAGQYEPGFDTTKWGARSATAKDFAAGKSAQNITSFNTAISHLDTLDKAATALNNTWSPTWNSVANMVANAKGDARVKQFDLAKTAVADELTRAFRGTGGNVHDLVQWENAINSAGSPDQLKATIKQAVELLRGRIDSLGDTYNRGMNTQTGIVPLLSPKARTALGRLTGEGGGDAGGSKPADPLGIR